MSTISPAVVSLRQENLQLEDRAYISREHTEIFRSDVSDFLDRVREIAAHTCDLEALEEVARYFRNWKLWLASRMDYHYPQDLTYADFSEELVPLSKLQVIPSRRLSRNSSYDKIEGLLNLTNGNYYDLKGSSFFYGTGRDNVIKTLLKADYDIRIDSIGEAHEAATRSLVELSKVNRYSDFDFYLISWSQHMLGSIALLRHRPAQAYKYFDASLKTKGKISVPVEAKLVTQLGCAMSMSHIDSHDAARMFYELRDKLAENRGASGDRLHSRVESIVERQVGRIEFAQDRRKAAAETLYKSYESALNSNLGTLLVHSQILRGLTGNEDALAEIAPVALSLRRYLVFRVYFHRVLSHSTMGRWQFVNPRFYGNLELILKEAGLYRGQNQYDPKEYWHTPGRHPYPVHQNKVNS